MSEERIGTVELQDNAASIFFQLQNLEAAADGTSRLLPQSLWLDAVRILSDVVCAASMSESKMYALLLQ
jgi:hypothetical protein